MVNILHDYLGWHVLLISSKASFHACSCKPYLCAKCILEMLCTEMFISVLDSYARLMVLTASSELIFFYTVKNWKLKEKWIPCALAQTVPFHVLLNAGRITFQSLEWNLVMVNTSCRLCVVSFFINTVLHTCTLITLQYLQAM